MVKNTLQHSQATLVHLHKRFKFAYYMSPPCHFADAQCARCTLPSLIEAVKENNDYVCVCVLSVYALSKHRQAVQLASVYLPYPNTHTHGNRSRQASACPRLIQRTNQQSSSLAHFLLLATHTQQRCPQSHQCIFYLQKILTKKFIYFLFWLDLLVLQLARSN